MNRRTALKTTAGFLAGLLAPWRKPPLESVGFDLDGVANPLREISYRVGPVELWVETDAGWIKAHSVNEMAIRDRATGRWVLIPREQVKS